MKSIPIVAYRCRKCGRVHYPFHDRCLKCRGRDFDELHPEGHVRLVTFTQIFNLPWGFDERFLLIGIGEFENGVKAMGQIKTGDPTTLKAGMRMAATWEPVRRQSEEDVFGLKFAPV